MRCGPVCTGLAALALLLAGCGSGEGPATDPRPTASASPSAPPGLDPTPPQEPTGQADTTPSAIEYAGWFARLVQHAIEVRDPRPVSAEAFDQAACSTCRELATFISELVDGGYWQLADDLEIGRLKASRTDRGRQVAGSFRYPELEDVELDGTVHKTIPASRYRYSVDLTWEDSRSSWRVLDYTFERQAG